MNIYYFLINQIHLFHFHFIKIFLILETYKNLKNNFLLFFKTIIIYFD